MIVGIVELICAILGIIGIISRIACMVKLLSLGFKIILMTVVFFFIMTWIGWIMDFTKDPKWKPNTEEIVWIVVYNVMNILFFICAYFIFSLIASLAKVIQAGGTGWEKLNYIEIGEITEEASVGTYESEVPKRQKAQQRRNSDSDESEVDSNV